MQLLPALIIHVNNPGLPIWQVVPLTLLGGAIGLGLVWAVAELVKRPGDRRLRRRVEAVEAAAGTASPYGAVAVTQAAERLFTEMQSAWDAEDRERLAQISDPGLMADWVKRLDGYAAAGKRQRVAVLDGPQLDYVSLMADRGLVRLRVRAKLRRGFERTDSSQRPAPKRPVGGKIALVEFWTLSRSGDDWILYSTRSARLRAEYTGEPIVSVG
jgi:predicted lipid-binding transport protein (Tim44 family)